MKFKDYHIDKKIKSQLEYLGFNRPTDIQFRAIQAILDGEDVMAVAPTGTGKTAAFAIPVLQHVLQNRKGKHKHISTLVLVPTRGFFFVSLESQENHTSGAWLRGEN